MNPIFIAFGTYFVINAYIFGTLGRRKVPILLVKFPEWILSSSDESSSPSSSNSMSSVSSSSFSISSGSSGSSVTSSSMLSFKERVSLISSKKETRL